MIYFTSDTHYHHKNIVSGTTAWETYTGCRNFASLEEHDRALINNINATVKPDDVLYHLGDWSFGGKERIIEFRRAINCKNVHLILGNHDHHIENDSVLEHGLQDIKARSLFSSVQHYLELKINGRHFILCHFAMRVWNKSHKGSIMLYGHSHGTLDQLQPKFTSPTWIGDEYYIKNYKTMDVGIDTHPEFRPYSISEIIDIMDPKEVLLGVDHHNGDTAQ